MVALANIDIGRKIFLLINNRYHGTEWMPEPAKAASSRKSTLAAAAVRRSR
ncbi:MAG: hypothetical protein V4661_07560 [Pseudomonadota bacterium]